MYVTCPRCFGTDDVEYRRLPDQLIEYTCTAHHDDDRAEHTWLLSKQQATSSILAEEGVTDELLEPLLACVFPDEPFVEYGIVEHRLRISHPDVFAAHVRDRGHAMLAPGAGAATASSVRFGVALGRLARAGELATRSGPATGAWSYNGQVSYWAKSPRPLERLSWAEYCNRRGRSAEWTDEDRDGLA